MHECDCARIVYVMGLFGNINISKKHAYILWEEYSSMYAAGWLFLPDDDYELFEIVIGLYYA